jgi:MFS superfamily sulfate permease-like transporter
VEDFTLTPIKNFAQQHPKIASWIALAIGMVIILLWSAKDVGLLPTQLLALVVATILLAGLCVWIIGWEDDDEEEQPTEKKQA